MNFDIGYIIGTVDLIVGIIILILLSITTQRLKGSTLFWTSVLFLITAIIYVVHALVELSGLGEGLYAVTGLIATLMLAFTMVIIDITTKLLGVK